MTFNRNGPTVLGVYNMPPLDKPADRPKKFKRLRIDFTTGNGCCDFCHRELPSNTAIILTPIVYEPGKKKEFQAGRDCADNVSLAARHPLGDLTLGAKSPTVRQKKLSRKWLVEAVIDFDPQKIEQQEFESELSKNITYADLWRQLRRRGGDKVPAVIANAWQQYEADPQTAYWGDVDSLRKSHETPDSPYSLGRLLHTYATVRWIDKCMAKMEDKDFWRQQRRDLLDSHASPADVIEKLDKVIASRSSNQKVLDPQALPPIELQMSLLPALETPKPREAIGQKIFSLPNGYYWNGAPV